MEDNIDNIRLTVRDIDAKLDALIAALGYELEIYFDEYGYRRMRLVSHNKNDQK